MDSAGVVAIMLVAGAFHAAWNLVAKQVPAVDRSLLLMSASLVIVVALAPWGLTHLPQENLGIGLACVAARGALNTLYLAGLSQAYRHLDLSLAYPLVRGTGPIVAVALAVVLLGERPALVGLVGLAVLSASILAMALTGRRAPSLSPSAAGAPRRRALGAGAVLLTGLTIGAYTVVDKVGVTYWHPVAYFWAMESVGLACIAVYLLFARRVGAFTSVVRRHLPRSLLCALLIGASYVLALFALEHALASYIAPLREVSVLFGVLLGMLVLKEDHGPRRIVAAVGIAAGLVLVGIAL